MSQLGDKTVDADHSVIGERAVDVPFAQLKNRPHISGPVDLRKDRSRIAGRGGLR
jgi:hypothetical protein